MTTKELAIATSTVWVLIAAILVMFMQAGFAFLEAGLTRMKNVGHIAAKNVLILALASVVYFLVGYGLAFGFPSEPNLPMRGPSRIAPASPASAPW